LLREARDAALAALEVEDIPYLRWAGATWAGVGLKRHAPGPTLGPPVGAIESDKTSIF